MEAEVYDKGSSDNLEQQIVDRLGERQQKVERMAEWEKTYAETIVSPRLWLKRITVVTAVAAMLAVAFVLWPKPQGNAIDALGIEPPYIDTEYRAAIPTLGEINQLIAQQNYSEALLSVETALSQSDQELGEMKEALTYMDDDELAYYMELEQNVNSELRWAYIYLLVREEHNEKAIAQLKLYLKMPKYTCQHRRDAQALIKKLKKSVK